MRLDVLEAGYGWGLHKIERLMGELKLRARPHPRALPADRGNRDPKQIAQYVPNRQFQATGPNQKWVTDFTYVWNAEGWLYVAVVLDLYSRGAVGWSMSKEIIAQLVTVALMFALWRRGRPEQLMHHSNQGSQYPSESVQRLLRNLGIKCSMSRSGNIWENSAIGRSL